MSELGEFQQEPYKKIIFKDGTVEIPTEPLCTIDQIHAAQEIIDQKSPDFIKLLPKEHAWGESKQLHEIQAQEQGMDVLENLEFDLNDPNARLLMFIGEIHDIGRVIDGLRRDKKPLPDGYEGLTHHGQFSVKTLEDWNALDSLPEETQKIIKFAVEHHAEKNKTALPENATDKEKIEYVYNCLFRDLDKLAIFKDKAENYLIDPKTREQQFKVVKGILGQDEAGNEKFQGENGQINPEGMDLFLNGKLMDVKIFNTYETYMLNVLGFIYDINLVSALKEVADSGIINKYLNYFEEKLPADQFQAINQKVRNYLSNLNIELP